MGDHVDFGIPCIHCWVFSWEGCWRKIGLDGKGDVYRIIGSMLQVPEQDRVRFRLSSYLQILKRLGQIHLLFQSRRYPEYQRLAGFSPNGLRMSNLYWGSSSHSKLVMYSTHA